MLGEKAIKICRKCEKLGHSKPKGPFIQIGRGKGKKILIIAESPAKNGWRISGKACYTPEGKLLATGKRINEYLKLFDLTIDQVSFTELTKCYIQDRKLLEKSGHNCFKYLIEQIDTLKPMLVITLGVIPNKIFCQQFRKEMSLGEIYEIGSFRYLPLYHPSPANPHGHKKNLKILDRLIKQLIWSRTPKQN